MGTTGVKSGSIVLHVESRNTVFEGLVELAQPPDDEIYESVDVGVGLLLHIDGLDLSLGLFLPDSKQVVHCVLEDLDHFFRDELFLHILHNVRPHRP